MRIFLDTANIEEIREAASWGVVAGVTTNPSLVAKEKTSDMREVVRRIAGIVSGPISAEVLSLEADAMTAEARDLAAVAPNVVIKIPMGVEGLKAVHRLTAEGVKTNVTLVFSANQALLAATAGATYVSPFIGRLDDISMDGMEVVRDIVTVFRNYGIKSQVIAASIRHSMHVLQAALAGADVATIPFAVLQQMTRHPLTDAGIKKFLEDWAKIAGGR
ncbi:MAG: fructose-6-phosphate aldolase [Firmicutes bacterium]|jgi:transaldolase|nr:fructose-6-phosphate aldolase [Bacillota bacterium]